MQLKFSVLLIAVSFLLAIVACSSADKPGVTGQTVSDSLSLTPVADESSASNQELQITGETFQIDNSHVSETCRSAERTPTPQPDEGWTAPYRVGTGEIPAITATPFGPPVPQWVPGRPGSIRLNDDLDVPGQVDLGTTAKFVMELSVSPGSEVEVPLDESRPFDFVVMRSSGEIVKRWIYLTDTDVPGKLKVRGFDPWKLEIEWDLTDDAGDPVAPGIYWVASTINTEASLRIDSGPRMMIVGETPRLADLLDVELEVTGEPVHGNFVDLKLCIANNSGDYLPFEYGVNFTHFKVETPEGWHVWPPEGNQIVPAIALRSTLLPGETDVRESGWDLRDINGELVPPGDYLVFGGISAAFSGEIQNGEETIWSEPVRVTVAAP